ncbi:hypothetical protein, partial [Falsiroseomonas oryzae]|uniref:hypothetical protein n=1 Tax=Falsiroseomonas oryzae TaxID=2766473 RepID=UPI0022EB4D31
VAAGLAAALRRAPGEAATRLLLLHGDADAEEDADCAALARGLGVPGQGFARVVLPGAGFGWDLDGASGRGHTMLPDPARPERRRRAVPDPQRALIALDRILYFLMDALGDVAAPAQLSSSESQ